MLNLRRHFPILRNGFLDFLNPNSNHWRHHARFIATSRSLEPCRTYQVVVAATREMGIAKHGKIPWYLPSDLKFFKHLTTKTSDPQKRNAVLMGRKTWESLPADHRPLRRRLNIVITRSAHSNTKTGEKEEEEDVVTCGDLSSAFHLLSHDPTVEKTFVIGGGQILRETLNGPMCEAIHITWIETSFQCDTFIPPIDLSSFRLCHSSLPLQENNVQFCFQSYVRVS